MLQMLFYPLIDWRRSHLTLINGNEMDQMSIVVEISFSDDRHYASLINGHIFRQIKFNQNYETF